MSDHPLVSFIVPAYNTGRYVRESIESALGQTYDNIEVLVVDDGSDDETVPVLEEMAATDPRLRVARQDHRGLRVACELARSMARGSLLARHDSDDVALPDRIEKQVAYFLAHPEVVLLGGSTILVDASGRPFSTGSYPTEHEGIVALFPVTTPVMDPTTMIRADALDAIGGWRTTMRVAGDYDLLLRMAEVGRLANLPDPLVHYRVHPGQVSGSRILECTYVSLAAFEASKARHAGQPDPLDGVTTFDDALMRELGISDERVAAFALDLTLWWAKLRERSGDRTTARSLWKRARAMAGNDPARLAQVLGSERRVAIEQDRPWRARALRVETLLRTRMNPPA